MEMKSCRNEMNVNFAQSNFSEQDLKVDMRSIFELVGSKW